MLSNVSGMSSNATRYCSIESCRNKHKAKGWCRKHYSKWVNHGDPLFEPGPVQKCPSECGCRKHAGNKRVDKVSCECLHCGEITLRLPCHSSRKFCDRTCANAFKWSNRGSRERVGNRVCVTCGAVYAAKNGNQIYCSRKCANKASKDRATSKIEKTRENGNIGSCPEDLRAGMLLDQACVCAICEQPESDRRLSADHCHETGVWRGMLCDFCNRGLGSFRDNPDLLLAAAFYLVKGVDILNATV